MNLVPVEQKSVSFQNAKLMAFKASDGNIYAGVKWICQGLGFDDRKQRAEVERMTKDVVLNKGVQKIGYPTTGGIQEATCINLNFLPLWLAKINANIIKDKQIQDKLIQYQIKAKDVLAEAFLQKQFAVPQTYADALRIAADLAEENQKLLPKAESFDSFISSEGLLSVSEAAESLRFIGAGPKKLFKVLVKQAIFFPKSGKYYPYQQYIDRGYFELKQSTYLQKKKNEETGEEKPYSKIYVTPTGLDWLSRYLKVRGYKKIKGGVA